MSLSLVPEAKRLTYSRIAGAAFLLYILAGLAESMLFDNVIGSSRSASGIDASLIENGLLLRACAVLSLMTIICALVLAVSLFALTRQGDFDLAILALGARVAEAVIGSIYAVIPLGILAAAVSADAPTQAGGIIYTLIGLRQGASLISAMCFAIGSAVFAYLFLRGRLIPSHLAWFGLGASVLLLVTLPVQIATGATGLIGWLIWLPMLVFEVWLALRLLLKGVDRLDRQL